MKKLGIITFNRALNYGAVLQAYAMKRVCEKLGYETTIIDYNAGNDIGPRPFYAFAHAINKKRAFPKFMKALLSYPFDRRRWRAFRCFRDDYLNESQQCVNKDQIRELGFDVYVTGSDQIWNYNITGGRFDPVYFGDISEEAITVVYGASAHDIPFPLGKELDFEKNLRSTGAIIGIREHKLAEYAEILTGKNYPVVLDPTLLAGRTILEDIESSRKQRNPYILLYQIDSNPVSDITIRSLEKRFKCKVLSMTVPKILSMHGKRGYQGPEEFLALLDHAEFLVTNSFHGVALSLLWHKQFYVYDNNGVMTRIDDLLQSLELKDRKVTLVSDIDLENTIDYKIVDEKLEILRTRSLKFLSMALQGEEIECSSEEKKKLFKPLRKREQSDCSGCTACVDICPVNAILMKDDSEGFSYPTIREDICIHCGKCDQFCSFKAMPRRSKDDLPEAYGVKHKNLTTRTSSRSGGAFIGFSDYILQHNGVLYGSVLETNGEVEHIRAETSEARDLMKGAKYVQSRLDNIFEQVEQDLISGREVLFSGTPCQVSGLVSILDTKHINHDNLLTCDLVCHGVPSPKFWNDYYAYIQSKYKEGIRKADFRDKSFGWETHFESFVLESGRKIVSRDYTDLFYEHIMFRPSCYNCQFANTNRPGDVTLADFWGYEKTDPSFGDSCGVSLVLLNTQKGKTVFGKIRSDLDYIKCDIRNCMQPTLIKPSIPSPRRKMFWKCYQEKGIEATLKEYVKPLTMKRRVKRDLKKILYLTKLRKHP